MLVDRYGEVGLGEGERKLRRKVKRKGDGKERSESEEVGEEKKNNWVEARIREKER